MFEYAVGHVQETSGWRAYHVAGLEKFSRLIARDGYDLYVADPPTGTFFSVVERASETGEIATYKFTICEVTNTDYGCGIAAESGDGFVGGQFIIHHHETNRLRAVKLRRLWLQKPLQTLYKTWTKHCLESLD